jgi:fructose-1,6-bisphosphatase II
MTEYPYHNLGLDLVRSTEAAALSAGRWMGKGQSEQADNAATHAMENALNEINIKGRIVFSEQDKLRDTDRLHPGQPAGTGYGPEMDLVVDPIEGRRLLARGHPDAVSVAAAAPRNAFWAVPPAIYMEKLVVGPEVKDALVPECLTAPAAWTLALVARASGKDVSDLIVFLLNRQRHADLIKEIRETGARVMLRSEGDLVGAIKTISPSGGVDLLMGIGNFPEGLMAACAVKAANGGMLGRLAPQSESEFEAIEAAGFNTRDILTESDLVAGEKVFFAATGVTDGSLLKGIHYRGDRASSNSLIMRGETHTRRTINAEHLLEKTVES